MSCFIFVFYAQLPMTAVHGVSTCMYLFGLQQHSHKICILHIIICCYSANRNRNSVRGRYVVKNSWVVIYFLRCCLTIENSFQITFLVPLTIWANNYSLCIQPCIAYSLYVSGHAEARMSTEFVNYRRLDRCTLLSSRTIILQTIPNL